MCPRKVVLILAVGFFSFAAFIPHSACTYRDFNLYWFSCATSQYPSQQHDVSIFHTMNIPLWVCTLKYTHFWMRFQLSALLILFLIGWEHQKSPLDPEILLLTQSLLYWGGGRRAFIFFSLVPTIKLLKLFSTLQESYLMMILFLPFKLILFQYGTFAVIIILLLHVIPSIMTKNAVSWGKGFALFFGGFGGGGFV